MLDCGRNLLGSRPNVGDRVLHRVDPAHELLLDDAGVAAIRELVESASESLDPVALALGAFLQLVQHGAQVGRCGRLRRKPLLDLVNT